MNSACISVMTCYWASIPPLDFFSRHTLCMTQDHQSASHAQFTHLFDAACLHGCITLTLILLLLYSVNHDGNCYVEISF